jgi:hypothetical protein
MKTAYSIMALCLAGALAGCGQKAEHGHKEGDGHKHEEKGHTEHKADDRHKHGKEEENHGGEGQEHAEGESGVTFKEGRGLTFNPEVVQALGLKTVPADDRPLADEVKFLAQVFAVRPEVLAVASASEAQAAQLEKQAFTGAKLKRVDRASMEATGRVDVIFALDRDPPPQPGEFVEVKLAGEPRTVLTVPRSAVLDAASGTFVYVVNGEHYLRTPVKVGAKSREFVEITDGLYSGDIVVASPVEQLWLAELRLTKGGGHSH